mgnify:CR=1 FL=1
MARDVAVRSETRPTRRWGDWFDWSDRPFGDLFRMFDDWRPTGPGGLIGTEDRIRVEEEMRDHTLVVRAEIPGRISPSPSSSRHRSAAATGSKLAGR